MNASSFDTVMTSSTIFKCRLFGTKPAPVPWILWGPGFNGSPFKVCRITGEILPVQPAIALNSGLRCLITSATPVIVPPVPTAETKMSISPFVSAQISSAVVCW